MYYPKSQIKENLYTNGGEFVLKSTNEDYVGWYWAVSNGLFYTGKSPSSSYTEEIIKVFKVKPNLEENKKYSELFYGLNTINYLNIKEIEEMKKEIPSYYYPHPTQENYNNGYFYRYFCKKANENIFIEINEETYEKIINNNPEFDFFMFMPFRLKWIIKGNLQEVEQENIKTVAFFERENKFFGFQKYFKNYTQFWQP